MFTSKNASPIPIYKCYYFVYWKDRFINYAKSNRAMNNPHSLQEWFMTWAKNRCAVRGETLENGTNEYNNLIRNGETTTGVIIQNQLTKETLPFLQQHVYLVIGNNYENLKTVLIFWNELAKNQNLCILFVNPISSEKWIVYPYTHNRISEKATLEKGLRSLMDAVPQWSQN